MSIITLDLYFLFFEESIGIFMLGFFFSDSGQSILANEILVFIVNYKCTNQDDVLLSAIVK